MAMLGKMAVTFLFHFFGTGLADDHYVVERFPTYATARLAWPPSVIETVLAVQNDLRATHFPRRPVLDPRPGPAKHWSIKYNRAVYFQNANIASISNVKHTRILSSTADTS